jgi:zeaxanthin glucosyltransferase
MAHFGLVCPPGTSHVTGLTTIARELCARGHRATVFNILDVEDLAHREGVEFKALGVREHPKGSFKAFSEELSRLQGLQALRFGLKVARAEIAMLLQEAPDVMIEAGVDALLVDQGQPAGSTLAERLNVPFITICNAVPVDRDPDVPLSGTTWGPARSWTDRLRNRACYRIFDIAARPLRQTINLYRSRWGMTPLRSLFDTTSPILELAQQTADFDFPRKTPPHFHYIGLVRRMGSAQMRFPFERLDGRPLVYASLGTVRADGQGVFPRLAEACSGLDAQLVITLGGKGSVNDHTDLPGRPVVVDYAPQLAVLARAAVTVCHAGNNTVLESLSCAVPVVAVAMNGDQYGVAARLHHCGAGERIDARRLTASTLRGAISRLLSDPSYKARATAIQRSLAEAGGERRAADLVEETLGRLRTAA